MGVAKWHCLAPRKDLKDWISGNMVFGTYVDRLETWPGSSVGIATGYGLGRSGDRIPVGARFSAPVYTGSGPHLASCTMGTGSFPGIKTGWGVTLTPHLLLVTLVMKE